ncbi:Ig-like domain-containing protein [Brevibacillus centrosporus]|uniref:Ig-like domain-containing protein n=1 Tax=Brevibacillus centrosporus TaxID=54910 RepID=UPI003B021CDB
MTTLDATADVAVQEDGKTVIITTTADIETQFSVNAGTPFKLIVDGVTNEAGSAAPKFEQVLTVKDTTAPTYLSASASGKTGTTSITLKFSEPVDPTSGLVKVNGASTSVAAGSKPNELTVTTTSTLLAGQTYNLSIIDFKDYAGNLLANVDATVTVAGDVVAPTITAVKPVGDHKVEITFDKDMDINTVNTNNIRLLDANSTNLSANLVSLLPVGTSKKVFTLTLGGTLYSGNTFSATLVLTDSIMDAAGNKAATTSKPVTLTKDTTKPVASSLKFIKADATPAATYGGVAIANGALVVNYSEAVALTAGAGALTGVKVINNKGADVTANYITAVELGAAAVHPDKDTEVIIPLANAVTTDTALTLRLPGGLVEDDALVKNTDGASVNTVAVSGGSNVTDTQAPVIASATGVAAGAANVITVAVTEANDLDETTVLNLNNYRVDGAPLPAGTYVELDSTGAPNHVIKINLPAGTTAKSKNYSVNVSGIKDKAGNTAKTVAFNTVALNDDVAPVLNAGTVNSDGTASLSFSENVIGAVDADFVVTINGLELTDAAAYSVAAVTSGADAGKYLLTVTALVDNGADATAGTADDFLYIDADNSTGFNAGDIKLQTGSTVAAGNVDLNSAFVNSVKVATASTGLTGADAAGNSLKADVQVTVK